MTDQPNGAPESDSGRAMVNRASWEEFRSAGLLWWVNRGLHLFGWAITLEVDPAGEILAVYPSKCRFRGFDTESEDRGFRRLTEYLKREGSNLLRVLDEDDIAKGPQ